MKLVNASAMAESRVATLQGKNIGRLTRVTVVRISVLRCRVIGIKITSFIYL